MVPTVKWKHSRRYPQAIRPTARATLLRSIVYTSSDCEVMIYFHFQFLTNLAEIAAQAMLPQRIPLLCLRTIRTLFTTVTALPIAWTEVYPLAVVLGIVGVVIGICTCVVLFGLRKALKRGGLPLQPEMGK